jgi:hypothetical protein
MISSPPASGPLLGGSGGHVVGRITSHPSRPDPRHRVETTEPSAVKNAPSRPFHDHIHRPGAF